MLGAYSIRRRLIIILGLTVSLVTLVQAAVAYRVALREVNDISDYHMTQIAFAVRRGMPEPASPPPTHRLLDDEDRSFSLLVSPLPATPAKEPVRGFSTRQIGDKVFRVFSLPTRTELIEVLNDEATRSNNASKLALRTILPILMLGPLLLLTVWWGISRALRPLVKSRNEIAQRGANDLHALETRGVPEELLPFIVEINVLFARITTAFTAQQYFVADAAHELRSPLAALRLQVQGLQRATTTDARNIAAGRVMAGIDRATRLIEQMLVLAREESMAPDPAPGDLAQIVRLALSDVMPLAQARHIDIGANLNTDDTPFDIRCNAEALRILLRNLLENAVKYTPEKGVVELTLLREQRGEASLITLRVEDSGPGIPADEHTQIFERFRRGNSKHETCGSGLGLAIVQAIAERHRIQIELGRSAQLGGLAVTLHFA
ncbi:MAG TPA: ATP-binding protein [Rhodocyclaceae bacterium]|nr:ATP-binding protein [Rhodocyclaceae bacterium]